MRGNKNARPSAATLERAEESRTLCRADTTSHEQHTTSSPPNQFRVAGLLREGAGNGLHLRDLVRLTGQPERVVRLMIHAERRKGAPILSNCRDGYFLPGDDRERAACVRSLRHRAIEILRAARAIERGKD